MKTPNTDKLHEAKVVDKTQLNDDNIKAIESLSEEEVKQTINIANKLKNIPSTTGVMF